MIYLGDMSDKTESPVLNLLNRLLCVDLSAEEKLEMLEVEYSIPRTQKIEMELVHMCNLSQGVLERGIVRGIEQGELKKAIEIAKKLITRNTTINDIVDLTGLPSEIIQDLISKRLDAHVQFKVKAF